jgi:hypothetical protein
LEGVGKSTILRGLALSLIKSNWVILWLTDPIHFFEYDLGIISRTDREFILFIDDWSLVGDEKFGKDFLNRVDNSGKLRLIIGDTSVKRKIYRRYTSLNNYFEVSPAENHNIIKLSIIFNKANNTWINAAEGLLLSSINSNTPIFLIFYVLGRLTDKSQLAIDEDINSKFYEIIKDDLSRIESTFLGINKAIFCWLNIYRKHRLEIRWDILLKLTEYFSGESGISNQYLKYNDEVYLFNVLSHYISFERFTEPNLENTYRLNFHHEIFADTLLDILSQDLYFDSDTLVDIIEVLLKNEEFLTAYGWFNYYEQPLVEDLNQRFWNNKLLMPYKDKFPQSFRFPNKQIRILITKIQLMTDDFFRDDYLKLIYENAQAGEMDWGKELFWILRFFSDNILYNIFSTLIDFGCTNDIIVQACYLARNNDFNELSDLAVDPNT